MGLTKVGGSVLDSFKIDTTAEVSVTGSTTLTNAAFGKMHVCSGTTADYTVGLPAASGNAGKLIGIRISNACAKMIQLVANAGTQLIDGSLTRWMWANESAVLLCDGTGWTKIAGQSIPMICKISANTTQSIPNAAFTTAAMDIVQFDIGGLADLANDRINMRRSGKYNIVVSATLATATSHQIRIFGELVAYSDYGGELGGISNPLVIFSNFTGSATVSLQIYQGSGSAKTTGSSQYPSISVQEVPAW